MDARLVFEWSGEKAKNLVSDLSNKGHFGPGNDDIVNRDDAEYEVSLTVRLKHKRVRKKSNGAAAG